jgi:hypothetical protein
MSLRAWSLNSTPAAVMRETLQALEDSESCRAYPEHSCKFLNHFIARREDSLRLRPFR